jgi:hypothetical protein
MTGSLKEDADPDRMAGPLCTAYVADQEMVAAGLADYAPADVPPATDPLPPESSEAADLAQRGLLEDNDATENQENNNK